MGVTRAYAATRNLVENISPQLLISFGIAGTVETDLEIGDVVLSEACCRLNNEIFGAIISLELWLEAAREAVAKILSSRGRRQYIGTAVTTGGVQIDQSQLGGMQHPVLEMETAGIAAVAAVFSIPLLSIRAISDGPRAPIPFDLGKVVDENYNLKTSKLIKEIIHHPKIILHSRRMIQNSRIAADNAALTLIASLAEVT